MGTYCVSLDVLKMNVGIIGSKDQLINEYRVLLAEKLLNKSDYDIDSEIGTLELLKVSGCMLFDDQSRFIVNGGYKCPIVCLQLILLMFMFCPFRARHNLGRVAWRNVILCLMIYLIPRELTAIFKKTTFTKDISISYPCNSSLLQELE